MTPSPQIHSKQCHKQGHKQKLSTIFRPWWPWSLVSALFHGSNLTCFFCWSDGFVCAWLFIVAEIPPTPWCVGSLTAGCIPRPYWRGGFGLFWRLYRLNLRFSPANNFGQIKSRPVVEQWSAPRWLSPNHGSKLNIQRMVCFPVSLFENHFSDLESKESDCWFQLKY